MKKRKKTMLVIAALAVLLGIASWQLFLSAGNADASSEVKAGEQRNETGMQMDEAEDVDGGQTETGRVVSETQ